MTKLSSRLRSLVSDVKASHTDVPIGGAAAGLYNSLKTEAERSTKGRLVSRWSSMTENTDGLVLKAIFEGPHAMSVATQVGRRFESMDGVTVTVEKKGRTAVVCLRPPREISHVDA